MRRLIVLATTLVAALLIAGCGGGTGIETQTVPVDDTNQTTPDTATTDTTVPEDTDQAPSSVANLQIIIQANPEGSASIAWQLQCDPDDGDWPDVAGACKGLSAAVLSPLAPKREKVVALTDQPVQVIGSAYGRNVALTFPVRAPKNVSKRYEAFKKAVGIQAFNKAAKITKQVQFKTHH